MTCGWPCRRGGCARWKGRGVVCKDRPADGNAAAAPILGENVKRGAKRPGEGLLWENHSLFPWAGAPFR